MSPLEVLQFIGYSTGAALHLWMGALLLKRRRGLGKVERVLLLLAFGMGVWHASNLLVALHGLLGLERERWAFALRLVDTLAVTSITLSYSFLLHVHLHLWASARNRTLTLTEKVRVYLCYAPALFLVTAIPHLWAGTYEPMLERFAHTFVPFSTGVTYSLAFAAWAGYVLVFVAVTDVLIARLSSNAGERRSLRTLAASLIGIALLILAVYGFGVGEGTKLGLYLKTLANLGSLLPSALIAYYIYRYRYLELIIKESLIAATFAVVVLGVYLLIIRTFSEWLTVGFGVRAGAVEALLILALALVAAPLRGWLERRFHRLFEREAALYRETVARIGSHAGQYRKLPELLRFVEERTAQSLGLRRVQLIVRHQHQGGAEAEFEEGNGEKPGAGDLKESKEWVDRVLNILRDRGWAALEGGRILHERGYELAYALRREDRAVGLMLVDAAGDALTPDARAVLEVLAGQVAIAIEDSRLVEENVRLERRLAQGERLAALGQMAATVAHEVKNPLSAIKSIAQVMREDESLNRDYARDLNLIVGETDRLNRSVTQLLSFARHAPSSISPSRADELIQTVVQLFLTEASGRGIKIDCRAQIQAELDGVSASAIRDALSNLLINAIQATPIGGRIVVEAMLEGDELLLIVADSGKGIPAEIRERVWEPFFTTRQRGTGLGLAIVRKRMEEANGSARLLAPREGEGARFELRVPLTSKDFP
jgi:signal transduction histidine kinase